MATNMTFADGDQLSVICSAPATPGSGDPVLFGQRPGVALTDERSDGTTTVKFSGVFLLEVEGANNAGNVAVAAGDILYYDAAATVKINKDNTNGVRFGYAGDGSASGNLVASGATGTIPVTVGY